MQEASNSAPPKSEIAMPFIRIIRMYSAAAKSRSFVVFIEHRRKCDPPHIVTGKYLRTKTGGAVFPEPFVMQAENGDVNRAAQDIFNCLQGRMQEEKALRLIRQFAEAAERFTITPSTTF
jgi:hypothetical protein